jgi:predicted amidohydrolase
VGDAVSSGAELVVLPENFAFMGGGEAEKRAIAETLVSAPALRAEGVSVPALGADGGAGVSPGPILKTLRDLASTHRVHVLGGGMPEKSADPARPYNSSVLVGPDGAVVAVYRKVHLFDVTLMDGTNLSESVATSAGEQAIVADVQGVRLGMSVCYDVRFPELYRRLVDQGARVVTVPAAFTLTTGKDHWHALLRARAIENQVYVLAAAQHGKHPRGRTTYGKSLVCDPWGSVLAECAEGEGFAVARLDFGYQDRVRASLPALSHRRW